MGLGIIIPNSYFLIPTSIVIVLITGINGYVASHAAKHFHHAGCRVFGTSRHPLSKELQPFVAQCFTVSLGGDLDKKILSGVTAVIHAAHSFKIEDSRLNTEGTKKWYREAKAAGVAHQIYISSYAAKPAAEAEYGKVKYDLEQFILSEGQCIVRPGLVVGSGGTFARMAGMIRRLPVIPLFDGGRQKISLIGVATLVVALERIAFGQRTGEYNLFNAEFWTIRHLTEYIAQCLKKRILVVPIPSRFMIGALRMLEILKLPLPFKSDNVISLASTQSNAYVPDLGQLGISDENLEDVVRKALLRI